MLKKIARLALVLWGKTAGAERSQFLHFPSQGASRHYNPPPNDFCKDCIWNRNISQIPYKYWRKNHTNIEPISYKYQTIVVCIFPSQWLAIHYNPPPNDFCKDCIWVDGTEIFHKYHSNIIQVPYTYNANIEQISCQYRERTNVFIFGFFCAFQIKICMKCRNQKILEKSPALDFLIVVSWSASLALFWRNLL